METAPQANNKAVAFQGSDQRPPKPHPVVIAMLMRRGAISPKAAQNRKLIPPAGQNSGVTPPVNSGADSETSGLLQPARSAL